MAEYETMVQRLGSEFLSHCTEPRIITNLNRLETYKNYLIESKAALSLKGAVRRSQDPVGCDQGSSADVHAVYRHNGLVRKLAVARCRAPDDRRVFDHFNFINGWQERFQPFELMLILAFSQRNCLTVGNYLRRK